MNGLTLVIGGSASGKSEYAEKLALKRAGSDCALYYVATMKASDAECENRIAVHRKRRENTPFVTLEIPCRLGQWCESIKKPAVVLVECISNLLANEMYGGYDTQDEKNDDLEFNSHMFCEKKESPVKRIVSDITSLSLQSCVLVVSNEVSLDGAIYGEETLEYIRNLGSINCELAKMAESVIEVVAGVPVEWK